MKFILDKSKARMYWSMYLIFMTLCLVALVFPQFSIAHKMVRYGTFVSSVLIFFAGYVIFFFLNLKLVVKNKWLFAGNICLICLNLTLVTLILVYDFRGIRELILVIITIASFLIIALKTLYILQLNYKSKI